MRLLNLFKKLTLLLGLGGFAFMAFSLYRPGQSDIKKNIEANIKNSQNITQAIRKKYKHYIYIMADGIATAKVIGQMQEENISLDQLENFEAAKNVLSIVTTDQGLPKLLGGVAHHTILNMAQKKNGKAAMNDAWETFFNDLDASKQFDKFYISNPEYYKTKSIQWCGINYVKVKNAPVVPLHSETCSNTSDHDVFNLVRQIPLDENNFSYFMSDQTHEGSQKEISTFIHQLIEIIHYLKEMGVYENTAIMVASDHGRSFSVKPNTFPTGNILKDQYSHYSIDSYPEGADWRKKDGKYTYSTSTSTTGPAYEFASIFHKPFGKGKGFRLDEDHIYSSFDTPAIIYNELGINKKNIEFNYNIPGHPTLNKLSDHYFTSEMEDRELFDAVHSDPWGVRDTYAYSRIVIWRQGHDKTVNGGVDITDYSMSDLFYPFLIFSQENSVEAFKNTLENMLNAHK